MFEFRTLKDTSVSLLIKCFNEAFSDYSLPVNLSEEQFCAFLKADRVDLALSFGAFFKGEPIGFMLNSSGIYHNEKIVFDAGTGIIPAFRGQGVFSRLLAAAEGEILKNGIRKYCLEVLQDNDRAIKIYQGQGFAITRRFLVFKSYEELNVLPDPSVRFTDVISFGTDRLEKCGLLNASYEHSMWIIREGDENYSVAYIEKGDAITACCVYSRHRCYVMQLGYTDIDDLRKLIVCLVSQCGNILIKNLDEDYVEVSDMLKATVFKVVAKQYEMTKELSFDR